MGDGALPGDGAASSRLLGTVVHRLVQRLGLSAANRDDGWLASVAERLVRHDEAMAMDAALTHEAVALYRAICAHPDVQAAFAAGEAFHEVPFTFSTEDGILRGTIDCLVRSGERITIIDFKTGRGAAADEQQMELYRQAVVALFPDCTVDTHIVYAGGARA